MVTGAGGRPGIGRSYAHLLAERGAKVVVNDLGLGPDGSGRLPTPADAVAAEIVEAGGEAVADDHTVATEDGARCVIRTALDTWGRVDVVINNAGVVIPAQFHEITSEHLQRTIDVHLMGTIWMCRAAWPVMTSQRYGRIVNTASFGIHGSRFLAHYGAAKAGIVGLSKGLAIEGADHGVHVNVISPGAGTAAAAYVLADDSYAKAMMQIPPELVAPVAAYLAHESCDLSGRLIVAAAGGFNEILYSQTVGFQDPALTMEVVAEHMGSALDQSGMVPFPDPVAMEAAMVQPPAPRPYQADDSVR